MPLGLWGATLCFSLGALIIMLGVAIFRSDATQRPNRLAALMLSFGGLGALQAGLELAALSMPRAVPPSATEFGRYLGILWQYFFPSLLLFVLYFPREPKWMTRIPGVGAFIFMPYLFHLGLTVLAERSGGTFFLSEFTHRSGEAWATALRPLQLVLRLFYEAHVFLFSLVNLGYVIVTLALLTARRRDARSPRLRDQLSAITLGLGFCLILYSVADPLPNIFNVRSVPGSLRAWMLVLALSVGSGSIAYAIVRHKFLEGGYILRRSIVFLLPALLLIMLSLAVVDVSRPLFKRLTTFDTRLIEPLILLFGISMLQPLVSRLEEAVEGFLQRDRREGRTVLQNLSRDIVTILDLQTLARRLTGSVGESLVVERCALLRRHGDGFEPLAAHDSEHPAGAHDGIPMAEPLGRCGAHLSAEALGTEPAYTRQLLDSGDIWAGSSAAESFQRAAEELRLDLFVPIQHGGVTLGALAIGRKLTGGRFNREDLSLLTALANQTGAAMKNASLYSESLIRAALEEELTLARQIQFMYLPSKFPVWENVEVFGLNQPSRQVGGDYFDVVSGTQSFLTAIADVAGKGVPAALVMSMIQASLRTQAPEERPVGEMIARINTLMLQSGVEGKFATVFLGRIDLETLVLRYSNAGHNPPLLLRADGRVEELSEGGLLLGVFQDPRVSEGSVQLFEGDRLVLYTDGVSEARNPAGDFYGEEGLQEALLRADPGLTAQELAERLHEEIREFSGGGELEDDMTLVVVRIPELSPTVPGERRHSVSRDHELMRTGSTTV